MSIYIKIDDKLKIVNWKPVTKFISKHVLNLTIFQPKNEIYASLDTYQDRTHYKF
jgi:hypothetical protein